MPVTSTLVSSRMWTSDLQKKLFNGVLFQAGWFAAVLGGNAWAVFALLLVLIVHSRWWVASPKEWWLILAVSLLGIGVDGFWFASGILVTDGQSLTGAPGIWYLPPWLGCIWLMFSMTLCHVFAWLHGRYILAAVLGGVAGPMSYLAGAKLSGLSLGLPLWQSFLTIGVAWGLLMPLFIGLAQRVYPKQ
ncbi:DUF2878 domain-containing protein [Aestuariicella sp. G3-2]|uniref:DUF2878 domain-containing protein n=1 Tax=Pseudomaricurvus albidus TaxID=2842452 RepID=UPI001C0E2129|nr:DUF2878 domain-containing protein [Aestuariicella albida]MBU3071634.1 DUF2878 domain-containing protein [Aestuariicella albida]